MTNIVKGIVPVVPFEDPQGLYAIPNRERMKNLHPHSLQPPSARLCQHMKLGLMEWLHLRLHLHCMCEGLSGLIRKKGCRDGLAGCFMPCLA